MIIVGNQFKNVLWVFLPLSWMGIIFYASSQPYEEQDLKPLLSSYVDLSFLQPYIENIVFHYHSSEVSVSELGVEGFVEFFIRKGAHVGVYTVLFLLIYIALAKNMEKKFIYLATLSFLLTFLYACSDEFHQSITPNRTPYFGDIVLDSIGAVIGACILSGFRYIGLFSDQIGKR